MNRMNTDNRESARLPPGTARRAIRFSFAQSMIGAIYGASTGGMFLIGYALRLGADNVRIGLMSTIPMLAIGVQLLTAGAIEKGVSRRRLTFIFALLNVLSWALVILIPYAADGASSSVKTSILIGIITCVTLFAFVSGNARGSWIGDLIPARFRGRFFGNAAMYAGIIAAVFAILEGWFLDVVKNMGIGAFSILFGFGMVFGLVNAWLFLPQPDVPLIRHEASGSLWRMIRETFANRLLMVVTAFVMVWSLQSVAGPFYATYMLRDMGMSFRGVGCVNAVWMISWLISGPIWGRAVDRWGCRPVLVACAAALGPIQAVWLWIDTPARVYAVIPVANVFAGFLTGGVGVGISALLYKATPAAGRSVQFAVYSVMVVLLAAPFPTLGGCLPGWLQRLGLSSDLRYTFYAAGLASLASALVARRIPEVGSCRTRHMLRELGGEWLPAALRWWE